VHHPELAVMLSLEEPTAAIQYLVTAPQLVVVQAVLPTIVTVIVTVVQVGAAAAALDTITDIQQIPHLAQTDLDLQVQPHQDRDSAAERAAALTTQVEEEALAAQELMLTMYHTVVQEEHRIFQVSYFTTVVVAVEPHTLTL
jgi:hypothetical protein